MWAMLAAIGLDLGFRIGVARRAESILTATGDPALPYAFMEHHGAAWGARRDVVGQVTAAIVAFREHMGEFLPPVGTHRMAVRYAELALDLLLLWVDRKSHVTGMRVAVRIDHVGRRFIRKHK